MCRICGIAAGSVDGYHSRVGQMLKVIAHGGPDDEGIYSDHRVTLGHRRLSIIDLSPAGHQPMLSPNEEIAITFNGEIYNYREVRRVLESNGAVFRTASDTEVIIEAYLAWGTGCFERLMGIFVFALYDRRKKKLLLVRDPVGVKPLYYSLQKDHLVFASEVKAFKTFQPQWREFEKWKILFLAFGFIPHPFTTLEGVFQLTPGTYLEVDLEHFSAEAEEKSYYSIFQSPSRRIRSEVDAIESVRESMRNALKRNLVADAPLGVFLSGGIDSSLLALLANEEVTGQLKTVSVNFEEATFDEGQFQKLVLQKTRKAIHQSYEVTESMFNNSLEDIWRAMDQPSIDGINSYFVSRCAHQSGLKAVLSGLGADELFGGYASFQRMTWIKTLRQLPFKKNLAGLISKYKDAFQRLHFLNIPGGVGDYLFLRGINTPDQIASTLQVEEEEVWKTLSGVPLHLPTSSQGPAYASFLELNFYMTGQLLKDTDIMSMWHGLEVRVPFLDVELIRTVMSIEDSIRFRSDQPKYLVTKAFEGMLPGEIVDRKKQGFTFPFELWLKNGLRNGEYFLKTDPSHTGVQGFLDGKTHWSKCWSGIVLNHFKA